MAIIKSTVKKACVLELLEPASSRSLFFKIFRANFSSPMPQTVAVWLHNLGHEVSFLTYTGFENLEKELPRKIDILFISSSTQSAFLAHAISNMYRKQGVVTVLGGPHARAYPSDSARYFDYVCGLADEKLLQELMGDFSAQPGGGVWIGSEKHPERLAPLRQRWRFFRDRNGKGGPFRWVSLLGSFGCPYHCSFCVDCDSDYRRIALDAIKEDLVFLNELPSPPAVIWCDPNFGVGFDDCMELIESTVKPGKIAFFAETVLSLLNQANLCRLKRNNFKAVLPGIESWFDYGNKTGGKDLKGHEKVEALAERCNQVCNEIPYVQANLLFGLDSEHGPEPFELTKKFVRAAPAVYPTFAWFSAFGKQSPLGRRLFAEKRIIDMPYYLMDGRTGSNCMPKNYSPEKFFENLIDLMQYAFSARMTARRVAAAKHPLVKWLHFHRTLAVEYPLIRYYRRVASQIAKDRDFRSFLYGNNPRPPAFFTDRVKKDLGSFYKHLPQGVVNQLQYGEPNLNPRTSMMYL